MQSLFNLVLRVMLVILGCIFLLPFILGTFDIFNWVLVSEKLSYVEWNVLKIILTFCFAWVGAIIIAIGLEN